MSIIFRQEAICLFFAVQCTDANVEKYSKIIDEIEDVDICYTRNPKRPRLLCTRVIYANSFDIHVYQPLKQQEVEINEANGEVVEDTVNDEEDADVNDEEDDDLDGGEDGDDDDLDGEEDEGDEVDEENHEGFLETKQQLKQFTNIVYMPVDPKSTMYERRTISSKQLMEEVQSYSLVFRGQPQSNFVAWYTTQKLVFLKADVKRKHEDSAAAKLSLREVFVLKDEYKGAVLGDILHLPKRYKQYISQLKQEGYRILGYCRKSKTAASNANIVSCLKAMMAGLRERSLVEKVFVTVSCNSKTPMKRRDLKKNSVLNELPDAAGDAQGLIEELSKLDKVCLVVIDSAGLTTNMDDLEAFICEHTCLKKIVVDTIAHDNQVHVLECEEEIVEKRMLMKFDGRQDLFHRSKMLSIILLYCFKRFLAT